MYKHKTDVVLHADPLLRILMNGKKESQGATSITFVPF